MSRYVLNDADRERVRELAGHFLGHYQTLDASKTIASIQEAAQQLPGGIRTFLASARSKELSVFYLSGLPVSGNLALTPDDWQSSATDSAGGLEEIILLMCATLLGDPFGWVSQQKGRLVQDVLPVKGKEQSLTNSSSRAELKPLAGSSPETSVHHSALPEWVIASWNWLSDADKAIEPVPPR